MLKASTLLLLTISIAAMISAGHANAGQLEDGQSAILRGDYSMAFATLRPLANTGDATAQYELGRMYEIGEGVAKNYSEAAIWYRKASLKGNSKAETSLAFLYARGLGVPQDDVQGRYWIGKASTGLDPRKKLGMLMMYSIERGGYDHGRPLSINELTARAIPHLEALANQGNPQAQCALVQMYATGEALPKNHDEVAAWRTKCLAEKHTSGGRVPPPINLPGPKPSPPQ